MAVFLIGIVLFVILASEAGMKAKDICIITVAIGIMGAFGWGYSRLDNKIDKISDRVATLESRVNSISMAATDGNITPQEAEKIGTDQFSLNTKAESAVSTFP